MSKNCYLTGKGLQKVEIALRKLSKCDIEQNCFKGVNKPFPENVNLSELERIVGMQRETLKKILHRKQSVNKKTLEDLFIALVIDNLEERDYEKRDRDPKNATFSNQMAIANTHQVSVQPFIQVSASDNGIPKVIRSISQNRINPEQDKSRD